MYLVRVFARLGDVRRILGIFAEVHPITTVGSVSGQVDVASGIDEPRTQRIGA